MSAKLIFYIGLILALLAGAAWGQEIPIAFIKVAEVKGLLDAGNEVMFVDVRSQEEYLDRHIKGAVSIPLNSLPERYQEIPRQRLVVLY